MSQEDQVESLGKLADKYRTAARQHATVKAELSRIADDLKAAERYIAERIGRRPSSRGSYLPKSMPTPEHIERLLGECSEHRHRANALAEDLKSTGLPVPPV